MAWPWQRPNLTDTVNARLRKAYHEAHLSQRSLPEAKPLVLLGNSQEKNYLYWGGHYIPFSAATQHFATIGTTGSGKSLLTNIALNCVLDSIAPGSDHRIIIFDTKGEVLEILKGKNIRYTLININDVRAAAWDIAADCNDYWKAEEIARILLPPHGKSDPFWQNGARAIVSGLILAYIHQNFEDWGLHDVYNGAIADEKTLIRLLEGFPGNQALIDMVLRTEADKTKAGIKMQLFTELKRLAPAAAHSQHARKKISLQKFLDEESVLVISQDLTAREISNPIIRAMFQRFVDFITASPDLTATRKNRRTFVFLDESRFIGELPGLLDLVTTGRSKGACVWLSIQGVEGFRAVYGQHVAEEILGNCNFKTFLRAPGPVTAKWASDLFGSVETWETAPSSNYNAGALSFSASKQRYKREAFLDSEFTHLPIPSPEHGLTGIFFSPLTNGYKEHISGQELDELKPPRSPIAKQIAKQRELQVVRPWSEAERAKFLRIKAHEVKTPPGKTIPTPEWVADIRRGVFDVVNDVIGASARSAVRQKRQRRK
jgi:hypothetical protein